MNSAEINKKRRTEVVQINVGANNTAGSFFFSQLPNIRAAAKIERIEAYDVTQVPLTLDNKAVISAAVLKKSYLKLVELGGTNAEIHVFPLWDLQQNTSNLLVADLNSQAIDWEKSGVFNPDGTGIAANESYLFKVVYIKQ